ALAEYRDGDLTVSWAIVEVAQDDLLPGAEMQGSVGDGEAPGRAKQSAAKVGIAVVIAPTCVVRVLVVGRCDLVEGALEAGYGAGFELDGGDAERGSEACHVDDAGFRPALRHDPLHPFREVDDVGIAPRREANGS